MPRFEVRQSTRLNLTSHAGLGLLGQCFEAAPVEPLVDARIPVSPSVRIVAPLVEIDSKRGRTRGPREVFT